MKYTRWTGWCGPSAVAWAYRGFYANYRKPHLIIFPFIRIIVKEHILNIIIEHGIVSRRGSDADHALYANILSYCVKTGNSYPMYQGGIIKQLKI